MKWKDIEDAYYYIKNNATVHKMEGDGWLVYRVGLVVRIDIKE